MSAAARHPVLPAAVLEVVAARFRLLGAASRLSIVNAVMNGPLTMSQLEAATGLEQSNLSRRVSELEQGGCVRRCRDGRHLVVEIADPALGRLCALVCGSLEAQAERGHAAFRALRSR